MTEVSKETEQVQRIFQVNKQVYVTKGYYRNIHSYCSYYIDCDVIGRMYFLDDIGTYFNDKYVSFNV